MPNTDLASIGRMIRERRRAKGLSQEQAARLSKITLVSFGRFERGESPARIDQFLRIAEILDIDFLPEVVKEKHNPSIEECVEEIERLAEIIRSKWQG